MDRDQEQRGQPLELSLLPYDPEKADAILRRLAELLFSIWRREYEGRADPGAAEPAPPEDDAEGELERVAV